MIDLHTHSTASDGTTSPKKLVDAAVAAELRGLALTDHDTVDGLKEAMAAASGTSLSFVPGVEISAKTDTTSLHILGLHIDPENPALTEALHWVVARRDERNQLMAAKLNQLDMSTAVDDVAKRCNANVLGRPHFALFLKEKGYVKSIQAAFDKYLGAGKPAYVPKQKLTGQRAIEVIRNAGGVPVLAHPSDLHLGQGDLERFVRQLVEYGLAGIETHYSGYAHSQTMQYGRLAKKYGLVESGGSDYHGEIKPGLALGRGPGGLRVPDELLAPLAKRAEQIRNEQRRECVGIEPT